MWLLETKLVSVVLAAAGGINSVSSQCCNYRWCWYQWFMLLPEAIWMPMACAHIEGQTDVQSPFFPWGPGWSSCDHCCVCGLCCHLRTCWWLWSWMLGGQCCCLWSALSLEAMFRSMVHAAPREHVEVHEPCCSQRPWGCMQSILSQDTHREEFHDSIISVCCHWLLRAGKLLFLHWQFLAECG